MKFSVLTWIGVLIAAAGWGFLIFGPFESMWSEAIGQSFADSVAKSANQIIYLGYMLITWGVLGTGFRSLVAD